MDPVLLRWLRGFDFCSEELAYPTWFLLATIRHCRHISAQARDAHRGKYGEEIPPFRMSIHVGEDFARLADGLRRTYELLHFNGLHVGDRIGHGVVLGTDPVQWVEENALVLQRRGHRVDDLLWELYLYRSGKVEIESSRIVAVEAELRRLLREWFKERWDLEDAVTAWERRHTWGPAVENWDTIRQESRSGEKWQSMLQALCTEQGLWKRGDDAVEVGATEDEGRFLTRAQEHIRQLVRERDITVETNPTSNQLIGSINRLEDHPAFRIHPLDSSSATKALRLTVNDDNPLTFATKLADEYAYVHAALLRRGHGEAGTRWLDISREASLLCRFTVPGSKDDLINWHGNRGRRTGPYGG